MFISFVVRSDLVVIILEMQFIILLIKFVPPRLKAQAAEDIVKSINFLQSLRFLPENVENRHDPEDIHEEKRQEPNYNVRGFIL